MNILQKAINNEFQNLYEQEDRLKEFSSNRVDDDLVWSALKKLFKKKNGRMFTGIPTNTIGVYRIIYEPTMETKYIGVGIIGQRLSAHKQMFINKGKTKIHNGTSTKSPTANHMYNFDRHRGHWLFSWCEIKNRSLANEVERLLILIEQPEFNNLSMAGK